MEKSSLLPRKLLNSKENLRIDKNLGYHILDFREQLPEVQLLIKNLIVYMSYKFQKTLFGYIEFDPYDFAKTMKIDRKELFKEAADPIYYKIKGRSRAELKALEKEYGNMSEYRCWDTNIENAFLILQNSSIHKIYKVSNEDKSEKITIDNFRYIDTFHVLFRRVGKTKKLVFQYEPSKKFEESLKRFFYLTNINTFIELRSSNLEDCYFKLFERIQDEELKNNTNIDFGFKEITELVGLKVPDEYTENKFSDIKKKVNNKLKKFIAVVKNDIKELSFDWVKGDNSRYKNTVSFNWVGKTSQEKSIEKRKIFDDLFYTELLKTLSSHFSNEYPEYAAQEELQVNLFIRWFFSLNEEIMNFKISTYVYVFASLWGTRTNKDIKDEGRRFFVDLCCTYAKFFKEGASYSKYIYYTKGSFYLYDKKHEALYNTDTLKEFIVHLYQQRNYFGSIKDLYI